MNENDQPSIPENVLVRLKTKLNGVLGLNPPSMKILIDRFITANFGHANSKTHFAKVNTYNELSSDKMTIKVFFKYLVIARFRKVTITITGTTLSGKEVSVSEDVNLVNPRNVVDNKERT